jgi:hypothetical protein
MAWLKRNAPLVLLGAALLAAAVLLLALSSGLTFFQDTWSFLMYRRGFDADAFLLPHNEHIVLVPVAIQKLLLEVFGMDSAAPERAVLVAMMLATATLLFVYVRRRIGPWPALFAATLLLFVGPAWQVLLWPFEMGYVGAVLFGIAMLLALDRDDGRGDLVACVCLALAIGFSSLGVAFAAGAAVDVLLRRDSRGLRRAYVPAIPLLLYALWYLGWGSDAETNLTLRNVLSSLPFVFEGLAASLDSVLGLSTIAVDGAGEPTWGRPLLAAAIVLLIYGQVRRPGFSPRLWPVAATVAAFWLLAAFNYIPGREAHTSRYMYAGAAFVLLLAADLLRGVRISRTVLLVAAAVTVAAVAANLVPLRDGERWLRAQTVLTRADLAAIEISRRTVDPSFGLTPEVAGTASLGDILAGNYLEAADEHGSPAYTQAELAAAPEEGRRQADVVLSRALGMVTETRQGVDPSAPRGACVAVSGERPRDVPISPGTTWIVVPPGGPAEFFLRRFTVGEYPVSTAGAAGDTTTLLEIPADASARPWRLRVEAEQGAEVCR